MTQPIKLKKQPNGVAIITFNRPESYNALDVAAMEQFAEVIARVKDDATVRALILTGAGDKAFCSGGDLNDLGGRHTAEDGRYFITVMGNALLTLEQLPIPVIAAINGYALGGGSEIALACDMRIADRHVKMGMVQIKMALTPGWGAGQRLMRVVGYAKAIELLLKGEVLRADDLLALNLVNQITDTGNALQATLQFADNIAQQSPDVVHGIKQLLQAGINQHYEQALQTEREIFPPLWAAQAHLDAVDKFLQRQAHKRQQKQETNNK